MFQDCSAVIGDDCGLVCLNHLVHPLGAQTRPNCICHAYREKKSVSYCLSEGGVKEAEPLAAVMFDLRTSIGFSLSWNLAPLLLGDP